MPQPVIHSFDVASQKAYRVVVFIVLQDQMSYVTAKTHLAPLKQLTLSWLELTYGHTDCY